MVTNRELIEDQLESGETVYLDDFGLEKVFKDKERICGRCGSSYHHKHGGWGSRCYECGEPWYDGCWVPSDDDEEEE